MYIGHRLARHRVSNKYHRPRRARGILVSDGFTAADDTQIQNHSAPIGGPWTLRTPDAGPPLPGQVTIQNNALTIVSGAEGCVIDTGTPDGTIRVRYTPGAGSRNGVMFRSASNGNCLSFRCRAPESSIELFPWQAGSIGLTIDSAAFTFNAGQTYVLEVEMQGQQITCSIDGVQVLQGTTALYETATEHGLTSYGSDYLETFDDFMVIR